MCPEWGEKGRLEMKPKEIVESVISQPKYRAIFLQYMTQDIKLLGGVMLKAQEMFWNNYAVDITRCLTASALSMFIFRLRYFDPNSFPIHLNNKNEDAFIRRGYYGGHVDVYKPHGKNLFYYDINSLYPTVMKDRDMPAGHPIWHRDLKDKDLNSLFGFIDARIICPKSIDKPFLPHRTYTGGLYFPTGEWADVYFTEELKYAQTLGYTVQPIRGYLFDRKASPFSTYVTDLYEKRRAAKKDGNKSMDFAYKLLMNSLYGRFGIHPISTTTTICDLEERNQLSFHDSYILVSEAKLSETNFLVSYKSNRMEADEYTWNSPTNSAVHLSAAITAYSRIHMYPYISRGDCFYTDTDSVVLGSPLPDDVVSSTELGMFKLEYKLKEAYFLAPKTYSILKEGDEKPIIKAKGPAHDQMDHAWFLDTYADPKKVKSVIVSYDFRVNWDSLQIGKKEGSVRMGNLHLNTKRIPVFDEKTNLWIDTIPKDIKDLSLSYIPDIMYFKEKELAAQFALEKQRLLESKDKESTEAIKAIEAENKAALEALSESKKNNDGRSSGKGSCYREKE